MRVLVVRPREAAEATAERLVALGHEAIVAPVLETRFTGEPAPEGTFAALLLTSANAVPPLSEEAERFREVPVFAVGSRTAAAATAAGFAVQPQAAGTGAALARAVAETCKPGSDLLHVAGRDRKAEPARTLAARGFVVMVWEAYEAALVDELPEAAARVLADRTLDAVLHYSRRSALHLATLAWADGLGEALAGPAHLALSADVADPLRRLALPRVTVAAEPNEASLLELLADPEAIGTGSSAPQSR